MRTLRNVGQIRRVFTVSDNKKRLEDVAEDFKGYDFQYALQSLEQLQSFVRDEKDLRDTDWQVLFDSRESEDSMSLVRESEFSPKVYAFVLEKDDGIEIGVTYMEPRLVWLEQAKDSYKEEDEESERNPVKNKSRRTKTRRAKQEKMEKKMRERNRERRDESDSSSGSSSGSSQRQNNNQSRIESNIDKKDLSIILSARIANVLRAGEFNDDFRAITDGYPELEDILQKIYDPESLREHKNRLPYEFSEAEIKSICEESKFLRGNSSNSFELRDTELDTVLKE